MINKYEIGETVECVDTMNKFEISDFEFINGFFLYYFSEGNCLPEKSIKPKRFRWLRNFIKTTDEEKTFQVQQVLNRMEKELCSILK